MKYEEKKSDVSLLKYQKEFFIKQIYKRNIIREIIVFMSFCENVFD